MAAPDLRDPHVDRDNPTAIHLLERHVATSRGQLLAAIRQRVGDPQLAEDILQDSLVRALRAAPALRHQDRLVAWFSRILQRAIVDSYRRRAVERRILVAAGPGQQDLPDTDEAADEGALCACFRALIPTLKPEYAELIEALDLGGGSPETVAARLHVTPNNLKVRHHRARQALRKRLEDTCGACAAGHCHSCDCGREVGRDPVTPGTARTQAAVAGVRVDAAAEHGSPAPRV